MAATGKTSARGYGVAHRKERDKWKPLIDRGEGMCLEAVCLAPSRAIKPGDPWDLAHTEDRGSYRGPAHPACNRSEGSRRRQAFRRKETRNGGPVKRWSPTRDW